MYDVRLFFDIGTRFKFIGCSSLKKKTEKKKKLSKRLSTSNAIRRHRFEEK